MSRQRLSLLVTGKVARCRREDRRQLARVLRVQVPFLSERHRRAHLRRDAELIALFQDIEAVIPPNQPDPNAPDFDFMEALRPITVKVFYGLKALDVRAMRKFVYGAAGYPLQETREEQEEFIGHVSALVRAVLQPWTSGALSSPPAGAREMTAILRVALGVINLRTEDETADQTLPPIIEELERIADRIERR